MPGPDSTDLAASSDDPGSMVQAAALARFPDPPTAALRLDACNGFHKIASVAHGEGRVLIDGSLFPFGAESTILVPAAVPHDLNGLRAAEGTLLAVDFRSGIALPDQAMVVSVPEGPDLDVIATAIRQFAHEHDSPDAGERPYRDLDMQARLHWAGLVSVAAMRAARALGEHPAPRRAETLMAAFARLVEARFREPVRIVEYAGEIGISRDYLEDICKRQSETTPLKFVQRRKLAEAKFLLQTGSLGVGEVAGSVGYASARHFARIFEDRFGRSPKACSARQYSLFGHGGKTG